MFFMQGNDCAMKNQRWIIIIVIMINEKNVMSEPLTGHPAQLPALT